MAELEMTMRPDTSLLDPDFTELVGRCYKTKPDKSDLRELRLKLQESPELGRIVFDYAATVRDKQINAVFKQEAVRIGVRANIDEIKGGMGYDQAPMIERLLIDGIVNAWLRYFMAEVAYQAALADNAIGMREKDFWQDVLESSHRRYLRTIESLARVRKITRATMQINIAESGSQQVNIAGDMVKKVKLAQAVKLALAAIDSEIKPLQFDANLFELHNLGAGNYGERAYKKRARLLEARAILAGE